MWNFVWGNKANWALFFHTKFHIQKLTVRTSEGSVHFDTWLNLGHLSHIILKTCNIILPKFEFQKVCLTNIKCYFLRSFLSQCEISVLFGISIWREYKFNFSFGTFHRYSTHLVLLRQVYLRQYTFRALNRPDIFYSTHASPTHASAASAMHTWIVHTQSLCTQCLLSRIISKSHDHNICRTKFPTFLSPELCCWINLLILFRFIIHQHINKFFQHIRFCC